MGRQATLSAMVAFRLLMYTRWGGALRFPLPSLLRDTPTLRLPRVSTSSLWSIAPPGGGTPPGPWASPRWPLSSCCRTRASNSPLTYKYLPGPALLLLSFTELSIPPPTASDLSTNFGRPPPNCCYCRRSSTLVMEKPPTVVVSLHLSETRPCLTQSSIVRSCVWYAFPIPAWIYPMRSGGCLVSPLGLGSRSARNWGGGWGVPTGSWSDPPSAGC